MPVPNCLILNAADADGELVRFAQGMREMPEVEIVRLSELTPADANAVPVGYMDDRYSGLCVLLEVRLDGATA
jgi:hypothetical protein